MRAWQITSPAGADGLTPVESDLRAPGPRDVVVRTRAVSLNHRDLLVAAGTYSRRMRPGLVPCSDAAGEIVDTGSEVTAFRTGDRVTSTFLPAWIDGPCPADASRGSLGAVDVDGVLADTLVLPEQAVIHAPPHLSFEEAATLPCAVLTAWHALFEEGPLPEGAAILTLGTGGVSVSAVQLALAAGCRVIATSSRAEKLDRLRALGVRGLINYREVEAWGDRARELTGGRGVDHVIEVGGQGTLKQSLRAVRPGGTISLIGVLSGDAPVNLTPVLMRNIRVQGVLVGSRAMFRRMNNALSAWKLHPLVDRVFPFDEAPGAFRYLASGAHFGKVVIALPDGRS